MKKTSASEDRLLKLLPFLCSQSFGLSAGELTSEHRSADSEPYIHPSLVEAPEQSVEALFSFLITIGQQDGSIVASGPGEASHLVDLFFGRVIAAEANGDDSEFVHAEHFVEALNDHETASDVGRVLIRAVVIVRRRVPDRGGSR